ASRGRAPRPARLVPDRRRRRAAADGPLGRRRARRRRRRRARPAMKLPSPAVVLGLARSGQAATAALAKRGVDVRGADRKLGNDEDMSLLDGVELLVKSPGVPGET